MKTSFSVQYQDEKRWSIFWNAPDPWITTYSFVKESEARKELSQSREDYPEHTWRLVQIIEVELGRETAICLTARERRYLRETLRVDMAEEAESLLLKLEAS